MKTNACLPSHTTTLHLSLPTPLAALFYFNVDGAYAEIKHFFPTTESSLASLNENAVEISLHLNLWAVLEFFTPPQTVD